MKWWEESVDEIFMGIFITIISCAALYKGGEAGIAVASAAISGMCVYIGGRQKKNGNH